MTTTLFKNGSIVDGSGRDAFDGSVLIEGDSIREVIQKGGAPHCGCPMNLTIV